MPNAVRALAHALLVASLFTSNGIAQDRQVTLIGRVTDESGAALPGVLVTATKPGLNAPVSALTDRTGHYVFPALPPGRYDVRFELAGFEARTSAAMLSETDGAILDEQLGLAALAETVTVVAPAPAPPPAPPPPPRPALIRMPEQALASVCGPSQPGAGVASGHILRHREDPNRQMYGRGDVLVLDVGADQQIAAGQNFVVRRRFRIGDKGAPLKEATFGEHTAGLIQVVETSESSSVALVVYACDELVSGDPIEPFDAMPQVAADTGGTPQFDDPARIVFGDDGRDTGAPPQLMVIDHGAEHGIARGQRLTIFRRPRGESGPVSTIGEAIVVNVRPNGATIRLERATDAVAVGDLVAMHR